MSAMHPGAGPCMCWRKQGVATAGPTWKGGEPPYSRSKKDSREVDLPGTIWLLVACSKYGFLSQISLFN